MNIDAFEILADADVRADLALLSVIQGATAASVSLNARILIAR